MSSFSCPIVQVNSVTNHPNADRLSIIALDGLGYTAISAKLDSGESRYKADDWVVYIPSGAVLPMFLLKTMGFWDEVAGKGTLAGSNGDRVKPLKLRGIFSEGLLFPVRDRNGSLYITDGEGDSVKVFAGEDVSRYLDIVKYEPPIPVHMAGEVANLSDHTIKYDFERYESVPDIFSRTDTVVATEKLHGTFSAILFVPNLNHSEMFGSQGEILVHSKGLGAQGLAFKNNQANDTNLYVKTLRNMLEKHNLELILRNISEHNNNCKVALFGEIFGKGVQDLHYGTTVPEFRVFDIKINNDWFPELLSMSRMGVDLYGLKQLDIVPELYRGPFDLDKLYAVRDGKSTIGSQHIREGIVVRTMVEARHVTHGRKICKMISPDYLLRKSKDATEYT